MTKSKPMHWLSRLHLAVLAALAIWWVAFLVQNTPARPLLRGVFSSAPAPQHRTTDSVFAATETFERRFGRFLAFLEHTVTDAAGGACVVILLWAGTRVYVRRAETWVQARGRGDAMALASEGLVERTRAANERKGGPR